MSTKVRRVGTIWAEPGFACGWYGYGAASDDSAIAFGALLMGERLQSPNDDLSGRDRLAELAFEPGSPAQQRFLILAARASVQLSRERTTQAAVPASVVHRAQETIPGEEAPAQ